MGGRIAQVPRRLGVTVDPGSTDQSGSAGMCVHRSNEARARTAVPLGDDGTR